MAYPFHSFQYDIYIDPGHGGIDPGAYGFGTREKDWTIKISLYQFNRLKELGVKVAISRTTDKTLDATPRTNLIKNKARYCMSNHWNAFNGKARGVEVIHSVWTGSSLAKRFADVICGVSGLPFRRVFSKQATWTNSKLDYYFMPRQTGNTETIIVEYGFIDHKADNDYYKNEENFYKVAERVVEEWCKVLGYKYVAPKGEGELTVSQFEKVMKEINALKKENTSLKKQIDKKADKHAERAVAESHKEAWEWLKKYGITTDGSNPQNPTTREQFATMLHRYHEKFIDKSDLPAADWVKDAVDWAVEHGVSDGSRPQDFASRQEVMKMFQNYDEEK